MTQPKASATTRSSSDGPIVSAANVTKRFDPRSPLVLDGVDLSVEPGEFVAVLGASGCGKSTLLNILAGLDEATSGEVTAAPSALMFQESALLPWLTAARNVDLALRLRGADSAERRSRTQELLELVKLQDAADKRPHELSGGMRQRVALARALAQERDLLLMDEPFGALDAITRDLLHDELERVWRATGRTIVFVTHNVREAVRLGQRVIMMSSRPGRILREWNVADEDRATLPNKLTYHLREEIARHAGR